MLATLLSHRATSWLAAYTCTQTASWQCVVNEKDPFGPTIDRPRRGVGNRPRQQRSRREVPANAQAEAEVRKRMQEEQAAAQAGQHWNSERPKS
jgi:hypothetical protein